MADTGDDATEARGPGRPYEEVMSPAHADMIRMYWKYAYPREKSLQDDERVNDQLYGPNAVPLRCRHDRRGTHCLYCKSAEAQHIPGAPQG